jgi:hypothetical protein
MEWVVDIYHVSQNLHACGKAMLGEGAQARSWGDRHQDRLLEIQGPRFIAVPLTLPRIDLDWGLLSRA